MNCPTCDGHGDVCDLCEQPLNCYRVCERCGGEFCSSLRGIGNNCFESPSHTCLKSDPAFLAELQRLRETPGAPEYQAAAELAGQGRLIP